MVFFLFVIKIKQERIQYNVLIVVLANIICYNLYFFIKSYTRIYLHIIFNHSLLWVLLSNGIYTSYQWEEGLMDKIVQTMDINLYWNPSNY